MQDITNKNAFAFTHEHRRVDNAIDLICNAQFSLPGGSYDPESVLNWLPGIAYQRELPPSWRFMFLSDACRDMTGYSPQQLLNTSLEFRDFIHEDDVDQLEHDINCALLDTNQYELQYRITDKAGTTRCVWDRGLVQFDSRGKRKALIGFMSDVTDKVASEQRYLTEQLRQGVALQQQLHAAQHRIRELEEKLEVAQPRAGETIDDVKNRAKSEIMATVNHEMRTPMNAVMGITELLKDTPMSAEQSNYLDMIQESGQRLLEIIGDVSDYADIHNDLLSLDQTAFNLPAMLGQCIDLYQPIARENGIPLLLELDPQTPMQLVGDVNRIQQVLLNLLSNAFKYTREGAVRLRVSACQREGSVSAQLNFAIEDTGIGISEEDQTRLFAPFEQINFSTCRQHGGTGLGLALCKKLVTLMNGKLSVSSKLGDGSCFRFSVSCQEAAKEPAEVREGEAALVSLCADYADLRVLVAEDNIVNQKVMVGLLKAIGVTPLVVNNGMEALYQVKQQKHFDLILMDCEMPEMDGYESARQIRRFENDANGRHASIVAVTAHVMNEFRERAMDSGMDDYMSKPVSKAKLLALFKKYFPRQ